MCINRYSDGTRLDKRVFLKAPGCVVVLGWWSGVLGSSAEGLSCHTHAGALSHTGENGAGKWMCLCLSYLLLLLSIEPGLGRGRARHSLPDLCTSKVLSLERWWWSPYTVYCVVTICCPTDMAVGKPVFILKKVIHAGIFQSFFPFQWKICEKTRNNNGWFCSGVLIVLKISICTILEA